MYFISSNISLQNGPTVAAWIQVSEGIAPVTAVLNTSTGLKYAGAIVAESGCWSMVKGGLTVDESGQAELYFEVPFRSLVSILLTIFLYIKLSKIFVLLFATLSYFSYLVLKY